MKKLLFLLLIALTKGVYAQVPIKSDGSQPKAASAARSQTLNSTMQGNADQNSRLLPMKTVGGVSRAAKPAAQPSKTSGGTGATVKNTLLPIKSGGATVRSAKVVAVPLRTGDNAGKKL